MKTLTISGTLREANGKKGAKQLRRQKNVPCILYGGGKENVCFATHENSFRKLLYTSDAYRVQLELNGNNHSAVLKDLQFHPVTDRIIHADFIAIDESKKITMAIPVKFIGTPRGIQDGGQMIIRLRKLKGAGLAANIPEYLEVNVEDIGIGGSRKISELKYEGVELLDPVNDVVVRVKAPRKEEELAPAAVTTEVTAPVAGEETMTEEQKAEAAKEGEKKPVEKKSDEKKPKEKGK